MVRVMGDVGALSLYQKDISRRVLRVTEYTVGSPFTMRRFERIKPNQLGFFKPSNTRRHNSSAIQMSFLSIILSNIIRTSSRLNTCVR